MAFYEKPYKHRPAQICPNCKGVKNTPSLGENYPALVKINIEHVTTPSRDGQRGKFSVLKHSCVLRFMFVFSFTAICVSLSASQTVVNIRIDI